MLDEKICSGEIFQAKNWQDNINSKFFGSSPKAINDYFSSQYLEHAVAEIPVMRSTQVQGEPEVIKTDSISTAQDHEGAGVSVLGGLISVGAGETDRHVVANETIEMKPGQSSVEQKVVGYRKVYSEAMTLPVSELLKGSGMESQAWIYGNSSSSGSASSSETVRSIHFVVAADTFVNADAKLVMTIQADTCKMN